MKNKVSIIGAGVGGLATAARLASRGYDVDVYEKLPRCGGRAHIIEDQGFKFDTGPSFVLMPDFFKEVFDYCGENIKDYLDLKVLDISYRIFYPDGDVFTVYQDSEKTKQEVEKFEQGGAKAFDAFIKETGKLYANVEPLLYKCFTPSHMLHPAYWSLIFKLNPFQSFWRLAKKFFKNDKLCYAFTFEAMFIGVSPFKTPAFYSVITYADHVQKISHPIGGMYQIPLALERLAGKFGAKFHYNCEIKEVQKRDGTLRLKREGGDVETDQVVINADYAYAKSRLLGLRIPQYEYSCSVYLIYLGLSKKLKGLDHHNLFFARDLEKNLEEVFDAHTVSADPSFYVHVPTVTDPSLAPPGKDIVYILIPVPNMEKSGGDFKEYEEGLRNFVIEKINKVTNENLEDLIEVEHRFYPEDFIKRYNINNGATFGLAHSLFQSAFFRPPNFEPKFKNVYFVGASTQPGGGLPPVIASSRIVADLINT